MTNFKQAKKPIDEQQQKNTFMNKFVEAINDTYGKKNPISVSKHT